MTEALANLKTNADADADADADVDAGNTVQNACRLYLSPARPSGSGWVYNGKGFGNKDVPWVREGGGCGQGNLPRKVAEPMLSTSLRSEVS